MAYLGDKHIEYVDSDYRIKGSVTQFEYILDLQSEQRFTHVAVLSASLPKTIYNVSSINNANTFILHEDGKYATIDIEPGSYGIRNFKYVLKNRLNALSPNAYTYTIAQPLTKIAGDTMRYTFTCSNTTSVIRFTFPDYSGLYRQMGFDYNSDNYFTSGSLESVNAVQFNAVPAIYIQSNICNQKSTLKGSSTLQEIFSFNTSDNQIISYQNNQVEFNSKRFIGRGNTYSFTLVDQDGFVIDTQGVALNFTLVFYRRNDYPEMAKNALIAQQFQELARKLLSD